MKSSLEKKVPTNMTNKSKITKIFNQKFNDR
jgi:hypothetical protein